MMMAEAEEEGGGGHGPAVPTVAVREAPGGLADDSEFFDAEGELLFSGVPSPRLPQRGKGAESTPARHLGPIADRGSPLLASIHAARILPAAPGAEVSDADGGLAKPTPAPFPEAAASATTAAAVAVMVSAAASPAGAHPLGEGSKAAPLFDYLKTFAEWTSDKVLVAEQTVRERLSGHRDSDIDEVQLQPCQRAVPPPLFLSLLSDLPLPTLIGRWG